MKTFAFAVLLLVNLSVSLAQRDNSIQVFAKVKEVQPRYKELQDFVINQVSGAKLNSSQLIYNFHSDVFTIKETFVRSTILDEGKVLFQLDSQDETVDEFCLGYIKGIVENSVNLAGVQYTNCLNNADNKLRAEVEAIYGKLQLDESKYAGIGLMDAFKGENIFVTPERIIEKLNAKVENMEEYPSSIVNDLVDAIHTFQINLDIVRVAYTTCMTNGKSLFTNGMDLSITQLQQTCLGTLVPEPTPSPAPEPTETTSELNTEANTEPAEVPDV